MINLKKHYLALMSLSVLSVLSVYYWSIKYHLAAGSPNRHELLQGEAIVQLYTAPFWLGLIGIVLISFRQFSIAKIALGFLPFTLIVLPTILRAL
ncbi:hypothetical protein OAG1_11760 [Agarivorans sp. OAG1]|uniref:hypothetical protein n=1 Tax=Agarivorans sp. OAG1 TaxID=3082387 RepID=UPI002B2D7234|nr:hypothetical protein OAG1_11760 [Agarivorans sp. OAG1]